jgi:polysaccharide deacetylase 2 family uncharacterized protein YibQ
MKFVPKIPKIDIRNISQSQKWIGGIILLIVLTLLTFTMKFFVGHEGRIEDALLAGQRLEISLATGEISGNAAASTEGEVKKEEAKDDKAAETPKKADDTAAAAKPAEAKPEEKTEEKPASEAGGAADSATETATEHPAEAVVTTEEVKPEAAESTEPAKAEDVSSEPLSEELAWIDTDYIGPRISDEMVEGLKGGAVAKKLELKKVSVSELGDKPIIVVIIKGLGLSASTTEEAFDLPASVTLGFSPYSPSIIDWVDKAKKKGHEVVLNVPMETKDFNINDPGPYALATSSSNEDNVTRLKMLLSLVKGYEAVYSEKEEIFTQAINSVKPVLESLKADGKYFIYGGGYAEFSLIQVAETIAYPILVNDILLDDEISESGINEKFRKVEEQANKRGYAVVMAHPYPITIRMLQRWLPQAESRGIKIAPVSVLLGKSFID